MEADPASNEQRFSIAEARARREAKAQKRDTKVDVVSDPATRQPPVPKQ